MLLEIPLFRFRRFGLLCRVFETTPVADIIIIIIIIIIINDVFLAVHHELTIY